MTLACDEIVTGTSAVLGPIDPQYAWMPAPILAALTEHSQTQAADRCAWDESRLAAEVAQHVRALDPRAARHYRNGRLEHMLRRVVRLTESRAPFRQGAPYGRSAADGWLRHYAACFGMFLPPRAEPDGLRTVKMIEETLRGLARHKGRAGALVHVFASAPGEAGLDLLN